MPVISDIEKENMTSIRNSRRPAEWNKKKTGPSRLSTQSVHAANSSPTSKDQQPQPQQDFSARSSLNDLFSKIDQDETESLLTSHNIRKELTKLQQRRQTSLEGLAFAANFPLGSSSASSVASSLPSRSLSSRTARFVVSFVPCQFAANVFCWKIYVIS